MLEATKCLQICRCSSGCDVFWCCSFTYLFYSREKHSDCLCWKFFFAVVATAIQRERVWTRAWCSFHASTNIKLGHLILSWGSIYLSICFILECLSICSSFVCAWTFASVSVLNHPPCLLLKILFRNCWKVASKSLATGVRVHWSDKLSFQIITSYKVFTTQLLSDINKTSMIYNNIISHLVEDIYSIYLPA